MNSDLCYFTAWLLGTIILTGTMAIFLEGKHTR